MDKDYVVEFLYLTMKSEISNRINFNKTIKVEVCGNICEIIVEEI